ncbi:hypothetical protein TIFTF001_056312 [Ficus carica]|uniref:Uncharacterized protein n=1 Tax=Ficus carica TaxID=3494 RepID=A0AA88EI84_FICCA|nr:hypothetical protein TIFTF001_056312 [Ficus carica]
MMSTQRLEMQHPHRACQIFRNLEFKLSNDLAVRFETRSLLISFFKALVRKQFCILQKWSKSRQAKGTSELGTWRRAASLKACCSRRGRRELRSDGVKLVIP